MLTPTWESSVGALLALLNGPGGRTIIMADLYTFFLTDGTVWRYTNAELAVPVNGNTWLVGPLLSRDRTSVSVGISVDELQIRLTASPTLMVGAKSMIQFISRGGLTNARLQLDRAFTALGGTSPTGVITLFTGRLSDIDGGRYEKTLHVVSDTELLDIMIPRDVYQPTCKNTLFDGNCGLSRAAFKVTGTATSSTDVTRTVFSHNVSTSVPAKFDLGVVKFTSGANAGRSLTIRRQGSGTFTMVAPLPFAVAPGDTFDAYPGCDKLVTTCEIKFGNKPGFRAEPWVPSPETVV